MHAHVTAVFPCRQIVAPATLKTSGRNRFRLADHAAADLVTDRAAVGFERRLVLALTGAAHVDPGRFPAAERACRPAAALLALAAGHLVERVGHPAAEL